jgi:hypothetical protein
MIRLVIGQGRYNRQVRIPFWALALMGGAVVLAGFLLLAFLASLALVIIPVCLIGAGAAHWFGKSDPSAHEPIFTRRRPADPSIIEGEYRVLDKESR